MNLITLIYFVLVTTFTPGPNNISSASFGMVYGYKRTLPYMYGIVAGFFLIMLACAVLSKTLIQVLPSIEVYMKYFGAGYILWLAWGSLHADYSITSNNRSRGQFRKGFLLQLLNPKVIVYGLTLYSTFLVSISNRFDYLVLTAILFAATTFCAISSWALFGAGISKHLKSASLKNTINIFLSLLLVYTAIDLSGILRAWINDLI